MQKKLTITIESLVRAHVVAESLAETYRAMGADDDRETEAEEWADETFGDVQDEAR
ncbi:MAG TPA: addiction module antitoxin [bacterium]|jgi:hypothetical protein